MRFLFLCFILLPCALVQAASIEAKVTAIDQEAKSLEVEILQSATEQFVPGQKKVFRVSRGDLEIGYLGRRIRGNAAFYGRAWHLEQVFPLDGEGADAVAEVNRAFHQLTAEMRRGKFLKKGDRLPNFGMIDQNGDFIQIQDFKGKPFVMNFIFTRCAAPTMCPASSTKMEALQEEARAAGLTELHFVTVSFDPAFDSPGILRSYAQGYGMELDNFHLLTYSQELIDDLLRQVGILTIEEDGTINHTMATLLVDATGKITYRAEGPSWKVAKFLEAARGL
ncbi:MAG: SCO family protein [Opitutales bacterium]